MRRRVLLTKLKLPIVAVTMVWPGISTMQQARAFLARTFVWAQNLNNSSTAYILAVCLYLILTYNTQKRCRNQKWREKIGGKARKKEEGLLLFLFLFTAENRFFSVHQKITSQKERKCEQIVRQTTTALLRRRHHAPLPWFWPPNQADNTPTNHSQLIGRHILQNLQRPFLYHANQIETSIILGSKSLGINISLWKWPVYSHSTLLSLLPVWQYPYAEAAIRDLWAHPACALPTYGPWPMPMYTFLHHHIFLKTQWPLSKKNS